MDRKREIEALEKGEFMKCPERGDLIKVYLSCNDNQFTFGRVRRVIWVGGFQKVEIKPCGYIHWSKVDYFLPENRVVMQFPEFFKTFKHKQVIF